MTTVAGILVPGTNSATGTPISNTSVQALSLDIIPLSGNNGATSPNIGGAANACLWPSSWSKNTSLPVCDLSKIFITAANNTDGVAYIYTTQP